MKTVVVEGITLRVPECPPEYQQFIPAPEPHKPVARYMRALALGYKHRKPVAFVGHAGSGKDAAIREFARAIGRPLVTISLAEGTTTDHLIGSPVPVPVEPSGFTIKWSDGILPMAIRMGAILNGSEGNAADNRVFMRVHEFLANSYSLNIPENPENPTEIISPVTEDGDWNGFMFVTSFNPSDSGQYAGAGNMNEATADRFIYVETDYLGIDDPEAEVDVLVEQSGADRDVCERIVNVYNVIRKRARLDEGQLANGLAPLFVVASTRTAIAAAQLSVDIPVMDALSLAFLARINPADRVVCERLFREQFAESENPFLADEAAIDPN